MNRQINSDRKELNNVVLYRMQVECSDECNILNLEVDRLQQQKLKFTSC